MNTGPPCIWSVIGLWCDIFFKGSYYIKVLTKIQFWFTKTLNIVLKSVVKENIQVWFYMCTQVFCKIFQLVFETIIICLLRMKKRTNCFHLSRIFLDYQAHIEIQNYSCLEWTFETSTKIKFNVGDFKMFSKPLIPIRYSLLNSYVQL